MRAGLRLDARAVPLPRRLSRRRAAGRGQPERWSRYVRDALIETTIARDVLLLSRVDKPALLRRLFELGCRYSGQIALLHQDARPAPGRGQHHDAGALPRSARRRRDAHRPAEVRRRRRAQARLEPQAAGAQHRADDRASRVFRLPRRARTASSGAAWSNRPSARTWSTRRPRDAASCSTGASATARSTSSFVQVGASSPSRSRAVAPRRTAGLAPSRGLQAETHLARGR